MPPPTRQQMLRELRHAFPRQALERDTLMVYVRELADVPPDVLEVTVRAVIRTAEFFPTVAELRLAAAERMLALPAEPQALEQIERRMAWAREGEEGRGDPPDVHPTVREALDRVGGYHAFRAADNAAIIRGQFARIYAELRASAIRAAQIGDLTPTTDPTDPPPPAVS